MIYRHLSPRGQLLSIRIQCLFIKDVAIRGKEDPLVQFDFWISTNSAQLGRQIKAFHLLNDPSQKI